MQEENLSIGCVEEVTKKALFMVYQESHLSLCPHFGLPSAPSVFVTMAATPIGCQGRK